MARGAQADDRRKLGDDFNRRGDVEELLQSQGWTTRNGKFWTRPGKNGGISGTLGVVGERKFYCWTSSAAPLEANTSYSPFALFATFYHGGDFSDAAVALVSEGYGDQDTQGGYAVGVAAAAILEGFKKDEDADIWDRLDSFNIATDDAIAEMERLETETIYAMKDLSAVGEWFVVYARWNTGKTLITLWLLIEAIKAGEIKGEDVYYLNADDTAVGAKDKAKILKEYGVRQIVPNVGDTDNCDKLIATLSLAKNARGKIIILDTLKKFTDLMDKRVQSKFGVTMRGFISKGGTAICLAHTNKHKDADGKSIASGTSDISDDCDCRYILDIDSGEDSNIRQITFKNEKQRAPVTSKVSFQYDASEGLTWRERFDSIQRIGEEEAQINYNAFMAATKRKEDKPIIDCIVAMLRRGAMPARDIIRANGDDVVGSQSERTRVLNDYEGEDWQRSKGQQWRLELLP